MSLSKELLDTLLPVLCLGIMTLQKLYLTFAYYLSRPFVTSYVAYINLDYSRRLTITNI